MKTIHSDKAFVRYLFLLLNLSVLVGQNLESPIEDTKEKLESYFQLPREQLYMHLNKSTFIKGETLWFKTYAYDLQNKKPSLATTNIEVGIYDGSGTLVKKQLFYAQGGQAIGQLELDSLFNSGTYFVRTTTHWLQNFKEDHDAVMPIRIVDFNNTDIQKEAGDPAFDLQFMPEGGHLVEGVENKVGFVLKDRHGKGVAFQKGMVYDRNGKLITTFKSNVFGLGSFLLNTVPNMEYRAEVPLDDGTLLQIPLPLAKKEGVVLRLVNRSYKDRYLQLRTNTITYAKIKDQPLYMMYHQDGKNNLAQLAFGDTQVLDLKIDTNKLWPGMNTLTILDAKGRPIAERLLFNRRGLKLTQTEISELRSEQKGDSISFYFSLKDPTTVNLQEEDFNLSVSVLPEETYAYNFQDNIQYSFLIKPYIKGYMENPHYYFNELSQKKDFDLDLLLLTQGWSRYDWDTIFSDPPKPKFEFQQGISLRSTVQKEAFAQKSRKGSRSRTKNKEVQLYVHPTANQIAAIATIGESNTVFVNNLFFAQGDTLKYSIVDPTGKLFKSMAQLEIRPRLLEDSLAIPEFMDPLGHQQPIALDFSEAELTAYRKRLISLREVVVTKDREPRKNGSFNPVPLSASEESQIDVDVVRTFPLLIDLIRFKGFNVAVNALNFSLSITSRLPNSFNSGGQPIVFLDGVRIEDINFLATLRTDEFETVYANPRDISYGLRGANGAIRLTSRRTALDYRKLSYDNSVQNYREVPLDFSFTTSKTYYNPVYSGYDTAFFDTYGTIHWQPEITVAPNGSFSVTTSFIPGKKYNFYFEGLSATGKLLTKRFTLEPEQEQ